MQQCRICKENLPFSFYYKSNNKSGFRTACKNCLCKQESARRAALSPEEKEELQETIEEWKDNNPERVKEHAAKWRKKN